MGTMVYSVLWVMQDLGVSENGGPSHSTLDSGILIIRTTK